MTNGLQPNRTERKFAIGSVWGTEPLHHHRGLAKGHNEHKTRVKNLEELLQRPDATPENLPERMNENLVIRVFL
uniref:Uncharacterized protein n=1 Tax=Romanomermis culicivorax TaxID=13658 RepID=A0A915L1V2_ROMCU